MEKPKVELGEWVTVATLAEQEGVSTNYIHNLVRDGKILGARVAELNDMLFVLKDAITQYNQTRDREKAERKALRKKTQLEQLATLNKKKQSGSYRQK